MTCHICGNAEHEAKCPWVKAYEYWPILDMNGDPLLKRVEFVTFADFPKQPDPPSWSLPNHITRQ